MKAMKIISLVCRCIVVSLLVVAFVLLFAEDLTTYKTEMWIGNSGNTQDSEFHFSNHNFFQRMETLNRKGFEVTIEYLLLASFAAALIVVIASFFVKRIRPFYFSVFTLLIIVFFIMLAEDANTTYVINHDYLGTIYGYNIYKHTTIEFGISYIPQIILVFFAFAFQIGGGILSFIVARKEKTLKKATNEQTADTQYAPAVADASNDSCVTTLLQYKTLLDAGIITQEEFDAKKKQLFDF